MRIQYIFYTLLAFDTVAVLGVPVETADPNSQLEVSSTAPSGPKAASPQQIFQQVVVDPAFCPSKGDSSGKFIFSQGFNTGCTIVVGDETVTLGRILGEGADGIVFDIPAGFNGQPAVAKQFHIAEKGLKEIDNLKRVQQFIAEAQQTDEQKTLFAIIKKMPGQKLKGEPNFPPFDHSKDWGMCPEFMEQIRKRIAEAVVKNAATSNGIVHNDFANNGNILLSGIDATGYEITVNLVDWGVTIDKGGRSDAEITALVIKNLTTAGTPNVFTDSECTKK